MSKPSILRTTTDEQALVGHLERIAGHTVRGWAVVLRVSRLADDSRANNLMFAHDRMREIAHMFNGAVFAMKSLDLICLFKDQRISQITKDVEKVRLLFLDDPLFMRPDVNPASFITYYNLDNQFAEFQTLARDLLASAKGEAPSQPLPPPAAVPTRSLDPGPLDAGKLGAVSVAVAAADVAATVRTQTVYMIAEGATPLPIFDEVYVSIAELERAATPGIQLAADRWLFQHLTRQFDRRVLELLSHAVKAPAVGMRPDMAALARIAQRGGFSLNLNAATVLSPEFRDFQQGLAPEIRESIVLELQLFDVFADFGAFLYIRDFLHERGFRVALDGVSPLSLPFVDRAALGFDLLKIVWSKDMAEAIVGGGAAIMKPLVERAGADRVILCRCDDHSAIDRGRAIGLSLFQGWHPEVLARPDAGSRRSA